jgi:hypothetical protein
MALDLAALFHKLPKSPCRRLHTAIYRGQGPPPGLSVLFLGAVLGLVVSLLIFGVGLSDSSKQGYRWEPKRISIVQSPIENPKSAIGIRGATTPLEPLFSPPHLPISPSPHPLTPSLFTPSPGYPPETPTYQRLLQSTWPSVYRHHVRLWFQCESGQDPGHYGQPGERRQI